LGLCGGLFGYIFERNESKIALTVNSEVKMAV